MMVCIPPRRTGNTACSFDKALYKRRHVVEKTFSKLKDWRRIATDMIAVPILFSQPSAVLLSLSFFLMDEP